MRAAILALLVCTASSHAYTVSDNRLLLTHISVDSTATLLLACDGTFSLARNTPAPHAHISVRVDGNVAWDLTPDTRVYYSKTGSVVSHEVTMDSDLLWEMIEGMDLVVHWGDADTDRFSLMGFSEHLKQLNCIPVPKQEVRL